MPFRPREETKPAACRRRDDNGKECGKEPAAWIAGVIEILGKEINVKVPICSQHLKETGVDASNFSIS